MPNKFALVTLTASLAVSTYLIVKELKARREFNKLLDALGQVPDSWRQAQPGRASAPVAEYTPWYDR